ncbi:MAG: hypothetical protein ACRC20_06400, partial [Segniliparus sp.]|uniref:hypothetical protein n=1 Tax=Segniliparus sp. TaxID=2804064 RepID=UPI003F2A25EB
MDDEFDVLGVPGGSLGGLAGWLAAFADELVFFAEDRERVAVPGEDGTRILRADGVGDGVEALAQFGGGFQGHGAAQVGQTRRAEPGVSRKLSAVADWGDGERALFMRPLPPPLALFGVQSQVLGLHEV